LLSIEAGDCWNSNNAKSRLFSSFYYIFKSLLLSCIKINFGSSISFSTTSISLSPYKVEFLREIFYWKIKT